MTQPIDPAAYREIPEHLASVVAQALVNLQCRGLYRDGKGRPRYWLPASVRATNEDFDAFIASSSPRQTPPYCTGVHEGDSCDCPPPMTVSDPSVGQQQGREEWVGCRPPGCTNRCGTRGTDRTVHDHDAPSPTLPARGS